MATIEDLLLEEDLLLNIFSHYVQSEGHVTFLRIIPRVCKHWNELSSKAPLWRDVRTDTWSYLLFLSRRGLLRNTRSLEFEYFDLSSSDRNVSVENIDRDLKALDLEDNDHIPCSDAIKRVTESCPHLERLRLTVLKPGNAMLREWDLFLTVRGPTLKHLDLSFYGSEEDGQQQRLVSGIAAKCPLLEKLAFFSANAPFPIQELGSRCPRLKELELHDFHLIAAGRDGNSGCGFKDLKKFRAICCDFSGLDLYSLLKDSVDLEHLELDHNNNLVFGNISKIPSDKVSFLKVELTDPGENLKALCEAVWKWRRTLSVLSLDDWQCDITPVLERFLCGNPNPQLESLSINDKIDPRLFEKLIQKCRNLIHLQVNWKEYEGREKMEEALEFLVKERNYV